MSKRLTQLRHSQTPASGSRTPVTSSSSRRPSISIPQGTQVNVTPLSSTRTRSAVAKPLAGKDAAASSKQTAKTLSGALVKLISQLKKRDNYAFFLQPVDPKEVPGYGDIIKKPMDLGTMSNKVDKGKYRSMDQFKDDFLLVTGNARTFNPPTTIFHSEAVKLEKWGLDAITRAVQKLVEAEQAAQAQAEEQALDVTGQADDYVKVESDGEGPPMHRSGSVSVDRGSRSMSANPMPLVKLGKRRGGYRPRGVPKSLDELWKVPGPDSGIGAFPHGSDLAGIMVELELMGKKVLTKKERQKLERQPLKMPLAADGSIDYVEMEDPFSLLSTFLPEPFAAPSLLLVPPPATQARFPRSSSAYSYGAMYPSVSVPPTCVSRPSLAEGEPASTSQAAWRSASGEQVYWSIQRPGSNGYRRILAAEEEDLRRRDLERELNQKARDTREPVPMDWGSSATLPMSWRPGDPMWYGDEGTIQAYIRDEARRMNEKLRYGGRADAGVADEGTSEEDVAKRKERAAAEGESWLENMVYGGFDGASYVKSVASFVGRALKNVGGDEDDSPMSPAEDDNIKTEDGLQPERPLKRKRVDEPEPGPIDLGMPLADYVQHTLIDPLTNGLHDVLDTIGQALDSPDTPVPRHLPSLPGLIHNSTRTVPLANQNLSEMRTINKGAIDMGAVLRTPDEFFFKDDEWTERSKKRTKLEHPLQSPELAPQEADGSTSDTKPIPPDAYLKFALAKAADSIVRVSSASPVRHTQNGTHARRVSLRNGDEAEDREMRRLRLNLLTMTRHVPLAELAPLDPALIPEHVRHLFPAQMTGGSA